MNPIDAGNGGYMFQEYLVVVIHIGYHHLELIIGILAGHQKALDDFIDCGHGLFKMLEPVWGMAIHADTHYRHQV